MALSRAADMLQTMARMQEEHNLQVHPDWRENNYAYYRAIWVECAEMLDHFGWKWWKKQDGDIDQVKLELVDIWHFGLSELMRAGELNDAIADELSAAERGGADAEVFRESIEQLALSSLSTQSFELERFTQAMCSLPMDYEELFELYVGKNVLNQFRQNNGYKTGGYKKVWDGREDNEHLVELLGSLSGEPHDLPVRLYEALEIRYRAA